MANRKWFINTISVCAAMLLICAAIMYITDPLLVFRKGDIFSYWVYDNVYSAPGVARQYEYDTVMTGSSMVKAFDSRDIDTAFNANSVKMSFDGATVRNIKEILDICFYEKPDLKRVIISLDVFSALTPYEQCYSQLPEYLYSEKVSYTSYLLNLNLLYHYVLVNTYNTVKGLKSEPALLETTGGTYGHEYTLSTYYKATPENTKPIDTRNYAQNVLDNLNYNLIPLVEAHPQTEFVFFIPPYSILAWQDKLVDTRFDPMIDSVRTLSEGLMRYDNVCVFSYVWDTDTIMNLDNYRDIWHYSPEVANSVVYKMKDGIGLLDASSCQTMFDEFKAFIKAFDYDAFVATYSE